MSMLLNTTIWYSNTTPILLNTTGSILPNTTLGGFNTTLGAFNTTQCRWMYWVVLDFNTTQYYKGQLADGSWKALEGTDVC